MKWDKDEHVAAGVSLAVILIVIVFIS